MNAPAVHLLTRHRALADHADDMEPELFDLQHRKPPYSYRFECCGCVVHVAASGDEGGDIVQTWDRCETYREENQ